MRISDWSSDVCSSDLPMAIWLARGATRSHAKSDGSTFPEFQNCFQEAKMSIKLTVPQAKELKPRITVFGVGGAGGNAVNNMIESGLRSEERRVGKACVSTCRCSGSPDH